MRFVDVVGNENIIKSMQAAIKRGHIGHAYIIDGAAGSGKRLLAGIFAAAVLCDKLEGGDPCGKCISCITLQSGNHPDVVYVRTQKKSIGIDDVREQIVENISVLPYSSEKRVYIIENAQMLTVPAQNALLKTLEDGPKYAVFLLLSENHKAFLPTILSRCVLYKITPLDDALIAAHLAARGIGAGTAAAASACAGGSIGRALAIASDESFMQFRSEILDMAHDIESKDIVEIFAMAKDTERYKERIGEALDILCIYFRNILVGGQINNLQRLIRKIRIIEDAKQKLNSNCNFLLTMEIMLLKLSGAA